MVVLGSAFDRTHNDIVETISFDVRHSYMGRCTQDR